MKKLLLTMLGVVGMLCSTSCSDEEIVASVEGDAVAQFTVELSDGSDASRAISDGLSVTELYYEVYSQVNGVATLMDNESLDAMVTLEKVTVDGKDVRRANVSLALVKGQAYDVVFWAQTPGAYDASNLRNIAVNQKENANNEAKDAFTAVYRTAKVTGPIKETIKLYRPFAQINFGTPATDIAAARAAGATIEKSAITVTGVATSYDALDEEGKGEKDTFTFELGNIQEGETLTVGTGTYKYLATAYVLYPGKAEDQVTSDLTMTVPTALNQDVVLTVPNAPVQRNFRTNVLGNLLTNTADFNVVVDPIYAGDKESINIWDGKTFAKPDYDEQTATYFVDSAEELAWIANLVNGTLPAEARSEVAKAENLNGKTVKLTKDINLAGQEWTPIGLGSNRFHGTIDGNGYGIYNLTVTQRHGNNSQAALVGNVAGTVTFRNLTIKNATIKCPDYTGDFYGAAVVGTMYGHVTFDNVKVEDSYISGNNKVAALVAHDGVCSSLTINNCHVSGVTFEALNTEDGGSVGGLVGYFQGAVKKDGVAAPYGEHIIQNSTVNDCTFNVVNSTNSGKRANAQLIGGIESKANQELVIENCSVQNNTWNEKFYKNGVEVAEADRFVSPYGVLIGGERNDVPEGVVIIDSKTFIADGVLQDNAGNYYIINAAGLKWVADVVNTTTPYTPTIFDNKEVKLMNDIDLNNQEWIPIGDDRSQRTEFHGIFDGQGYTVYNVMITKKTDRDDENKSSYGLFGNLKGTVKNLTVSNVSISGTPKFIGALVGRMNGGLVENCHVKNSSVTCKNWTIGGVVGQWNEGKISGCTIENSTIEGYGAVGGIVGIALNSGERTIENCTVKNCALVQNGSFGGIFDEMFGTVLGAIYSGELTVDLVDCVAEGNTIKGVSSNELCGYIAEGDVLKINGKDIVAPGLLKDSEGKYYVTNAEGLYHLNAKMADKSLGKDAVVNIDADIDFTGYTWTPVDSHADTKFTLKEINGNGHTISNLTINGQAMFRRFAGSGNVTIKDLTFDNAIVNSNGNINTSILTVQSYQNVLLNNVDVKNSTISGGYKVAPLIATVYNESSSTITATLKNCDVENCTVKATSYDFCTAGMVAFVYASDNDKIEFENCTVTNVKLIAPEDSYKAHAAIYTTGSGSLYNEADGVTVNNVTFEALK